MFDECKVVFVVLCLCYGVVVIEDEFYCEFVEVLYVVRLVKVWDCDGMVIYCLLFNKVLVFGMWFGWMSVGCWYVCVRMLKFVYSWYNVVLL